MSLRCTCICDGCKKEATTKGIVGIAPTPLLNTAPPGWYRAQVNVAPYLLHACKPACVARVNKRYDVEIDFIKG